MSYSVKILSAAKRDIEQATQWYNDRKKLLGKQFLSEIKHKTNLISEYPDIGRNRYKNVRTVILDKFPFMIHYIIDDTAHLITIIAVLHTSRSPDFWQRK